MNKKIKIISIILSAIIILGIIFALINNLAGVRCTEIYCEYKCSTQKERIEIECNTCSKTTFYFYTIILNIEKECSGKEIIICEDYKQIDERIGELTNCQIKSTLFGFSRPIDFFDWVKLTKQT